MYSAQVHDEAVDNRQFSAEISSSAYDRAIPGSVRRGPWSPEEDHKLMEIIAIYGPSNWVRVSLQIRTRSPKQCRERYHQNLKPSLNRSPITHEEGMQIERLVGKYGKKWAEIARHMAGRSDNAIKNWWNGGANRRRRATQMQRPSVDNSVAVSRTPSATDLHNGPMGQFSAQPGMVPVPVPVDSRAHFQEPGGPVTQPSMGHQIPPYVQAQQHFASTPNDSQIPGQIPTHIPTHIPSHISPHIPHPATPHMLPFPERSPVPQAARSNSIPHNFSSQIAPNSAAVPKSYIKLPTLPQVVFNTTIFGNPGRAGQSLHGDAAIPTSTNAGMAARPHTPTDASTGSAEGYFGARKSDPRGSYNSAVSANSGTAYSSIASASASASASVSAGSSIGSGNSVISHTGAPPLYHYNYHPHGARPHFSPSTSTESASFERRHSDHSHFSSTMAGHGAEDMHAKKGAACYVQAAPQSDHFVVPPFKSLVEGIHSPAREKPVAGAADGIRVSNLIN